MQMRRLAITLFCLLPMAALLYGCGSSSKSGGSINNVATVGDTACVQCHSAAKDPLTGEGLIDQYNKSAHASAASLNGTGCEACHGGGAQHQGVGPIAYPIPDATRCATCHTGTNSTEYVNSNHAILDTHYTDETRTLCLRCHSHEGAVLFNQRGITGGYPFLTAATTTSQLVLDRDPTKFKAINCQTCHEHGGALRTQYAQVSTADKTKVAWDPNKNLKVDQFDLCTSCHTYLSNDGTTIVAAGDATNAAAPTTEAHYHYNRWTRMIATTHYDNPATGTAAGNTTIEGYVIRTKGANPCFDCHGHEAKAATGSATESTIHTDWAKSAHAGHMLTVKETVAAGYTTAQRTDQTNAVMAAGATSASGIGWTYYNWDDSATRASCQRCHTATGAANYLSNPATYNPANNSFTHLSGWTTTTKTSPQQEVLYCWGCHDNAGTGSLRKPGAITANYTGNTYTYPDAKASNACISCHSGRETGESVKAATGDFSNKGFINSHYLTAGGTVFGNTGYHYTNRDYSIPDGDTHVKIGMGTTGNATVDAAAQNGMCVACHFGSVNGSHKLKPYTVYSATDTSINPLCINCHTTRGEGTNSYVTWLGDDATAATFTGSTHKARYQAGLEALRVLLQTKGYTFTAGYPYFAATNWLSAGDADTTGNVTGKNNMGAAFNYNLLIHDPGGVAHNRRYTRRLIYDAMDWLDNNQLDYSVSATLAALPDPAYKAAATAYLINAGTGNVNLGTPNERH